MMEFKRLLDLHIDNYSPSSNPKDCDIILSSKYKEYAKQLRYKYRGFKLKVT